MCLTQRKNGGEINTLNSRTDMSIQHNFDQAEKASWKAHSHEWLIAFRDFTHQVERIADGLEAINFALDGIGSEIHNGRKQWEQYKNNS